MFQKELFSGNNLTNIQNIQDIVLESMISLLTTGFVKNEACDVINEISTCHAYWYRLIQIVTVTVSVENTLCLCLFKMEENFMHLETHISIKRFLKWYEDVYVIFEKEITEIFIWKYA